MDSCRVFSIYQEVNGGIVKKYCPQHLVSGCLCYTACLLFFLSFFGLVLSAAVVGSGVGMGGLTAASRGRISWHLCTLVSLCLALLCTAHGEVGAPVE